MDIKPKKKIKTTTYEGRITRRELLESADVRGSQFDSIVVTFEASPVELAASMGAADHISFTLEVKENLGP